MDPNQNIPNQNQMPPAPPPAGIVPPAQQPPIPPTPPMSSQVENPKLNSKLILFIAVGILLLFVLGLIYFMAQQLNSSPQQESITAAPTQIPTPTMTPTPTPLSEKDIDTIDLGNPENDLKKIDDDVKQL